MSIYTLYNSYDLVLFWLINMQPHLRVAYKMVWLMVMKMSGLVYTCQYFSFAKVMINNFFIINH